MERIFVTGGTGYIGAYVLDVIAREHPDVHVTLLTRARDRAQGLEKLWNGLQMHMTEAEFWAFVPRVRFAFGDLTAPNLGLSDADRAQVAADTDSVLHIAASLNRKSEKACLNHNLRGTLSVIKLAQLILDTRGTLRRFSHVSTVAICGRRQSETVTEDAALDWDRSDYDPYARTKKFCEHMVRELLPDTQLTFFRPSIVMGDSRHDKTTQFDMVRAFCVLVDLPLLPFRGDTRLDIVNADFVGRAIAKLHLKNDPNHQIYHLSSGASAHTASQIASAMLARTGRRPPLFVPALEGGFRALMDRLASSNARNVLTLVGSLFKVFLPYITFDTVFDNTRATSELGFHPTSFLKYCGPLYAFSKQNRYDYPYTPLTQAEAPAP
jgi:nucleoside-diphosphate-sugar epimerase